ncbi:MSCRAMM family adhesin SdrC, partial [Myxococcota bacterium]|nr:MSCRAMM family adhesin SdrC [Myxococcota bacterium]
MGLAGGAGCQPEGDCTSRAWYADADGDRWGDPGREAVIACEAPAADLVDVAGDCDDGDPAVHPGAEELCDGAPDNDCDRDEDPAEVDGDRDGQSGCDGDCDDGDPTVYLGNAEVCDGADNDCDGAPGDEELDGDHDGQSACGGDCDDADPANLVGGTEVCDGADNDCDGEADEGLVGQAWSADADGDGHGDPGTTVTPCQPPGKGYVLDATDCDDADPDVHPGAPDVCDGVADNDCDGAPDPSEADGDGDGVSVCDGDCDDADPGRFPGNVEYCDGDDDDCDGTADEDVSFQTYHPDTDGDSYGDAGIGVSTCDGPPGGHVSDATDCDDADPAAYPGAPDACDGVADNDCDGAADPSEADADGDGASVCDGDCDDADPGRFPGNVEYCDGDDDDCDG